MPEETQRQILSGQIARPPFGPSSVAGLINISFETFPISYYADRSISWRKWEMFAAEIESEREREMCVSACVRESELNERYKEIVDSFP